MMQRLLVVAISLLLIANVQAAFQPLVSQLLDGDNWQITATNKSLNVKQARVPGSVYLDLERQGTLPALFYRFNPVDYEYVTKNNDFTYTSTFDITDPALLQTPYQDIVFHGIDTLSTITINGNSVTSTYNQFRRFTAVVSGLLYPTGNVIEIVIQSPFNYSNSLKHAYPYDIKSSTYTFIRKTCNDFGWDWSPAFANMGIHGSIEIRGYSTATIVDLLTIQQYGIDMTPSRRDELGVEDDYDVALNVTAYLMSTPAIPEDNMFEMWLHVSIPQLNIDTQSLFVLARRQDSSNGDEVQPFSLVIVIKAGSYNLWWPNGYGDHPLYNLTASIVYDQSNKKSVVDGLHRHRRMAPLTTMDSRTQRIGFRRVFVRRVPIAGQPGRTFFFEVNGAAMFMKGSNLVPVSPFHINDTEPTIRFLQSAVESHQTMVRVWGGGLYPNDDVYDWCDEHGLMMWQEFIFANSFYPVTDDFLQNVKEEANQQIRRLSSHASLVVWCGNNEIEGDYLTTAINGKDGVNHDHALIDYNNLFTNVIRAALIRELGMYADGTPHIEYLMSSPANGPISLKPFTWAWGASRDLSQGDMHFYNYNDDVSDPNHWPMPRFLTETGIQSYPSFITFEPVTAPEDWSLDSPLMQNRQHHPDGNKQQLLQIERHFIVPNATDARQRFDDYTYVSQAVSSIFYGTMMAYYRTLKDSAPAYTHGAMYWSLNDAWQAPTWASIEVEGRWKQSHYAVKRAFAPVMVFPLINQTNSHLQVSLVNDFNMTMNVQWTVQLMRWSDGSIVSSDVAGTSSMPRMSAHQVFDQPVQKFLCTPVTDCFFLAVALFSSDSCAGLPFQAESFLPITPLMNVTLPDPKIRVQVISSSSVSQERPYDACQIFTPAFYNSSDANADGLVTSIKLAVTSVAPAAYVWLESPLAGRFTDNSFLLLHQTPREIVFLGWEPFNATEFMQTVQVRSIRDTYTRG